MIRQKIYNYVGPVLAIAITLFSSLSHTQTSSGWICSTPKGWGWLKYWQPPGTTCVIVIYGEYVKGKTIPYWP